ncbi:MAG TPA: serine/threonine-protein kinase [Bryobacteraceae bacterium]|nr:serine/threonine-protein kinase [Bryobacteraceae bacterium]
MNYEIGSRVGDYEVLEVLGAGGMGRVYKVRNVISDRVEAMKIVLPDLQGDSDLADRFMREIKVQASLDHPNIAGLHTALRLDNQLLMLMEYVEGVTIETVMRSGRIPIDKAIDYTSQVLSALSYAHAHGVVHRDLKPGNMIVTPSGVVKLMDFGIAKMAADRKLTQVGSTVGSLYYMSPEQIKGAVDLDPRSDLYSLGISLYEMATGARPFQGDSEYSIMAAHLETNPPPPIQVDPNLPPALSQIILMALEKDPAQRFQTADAFRAALGSVRGSVRPAAAPVAAPVAVVPPPPPPPPARSHRGLYIALGSLATIAVIVAAVTQIPKFRHTAAETGPPAAVSTPAQQAPAEAPPAEAPPAATPSPAPAPAAKTAAPPVRRAPAAAASPQAPAPAQQQPVAQPVPPPPQAPPPQASAAAAAAADAAQAEQLEKIREQGSLLSIRVSTVKSSLDRLQKAQARSGLGLRADMAASAQRMDYLMNEADAAAQRGDAAAAQRNLDLAEKEVSKLEKFLGQ